MLFSVLGRGEIELFPNDVHVPHVIISITDPRSRPARLKTNEYTIGIARLSFDDLDEPPGLSFQMNYGPGRLFDREDAREIRRLIEGANPRAVVVHCEMGISRSAGVAAALAKHYNGDDRSFWNHPRYSPNKLVYKVLLEELRR